MPNAGFGLGIPYAVILDTIVFGEKDAQKLENDGSMAILNFPVQWPEKGDDLTPKERIETFSTSFDFPETVVFSSVFVTEVRKFIDPKAN